MSDELTLFGKPIIFEDERDRSAFARFRESLDKGPVPLPSPFLILGVDYEAPQQPEESPEEPTIAP